MKAKVSIFLLVVCLIANVLMAQPILQKYYVGALYFGSTPKEYYEFQNNLGLLAGTYTKLPVATGSLNTRLLYYDLNNLGAHLWWSKNVSLMELNVGFFQRPIAMFNRPDPISADGHFEPPCKGVIPGPATGVMSKFNFNKIGNQFLLGVYQTAKDSIELNFGISQKVGWLVKQISVSGYVTNYKSVTDNQVKGLAVNADFGQFSIMGFAGENKNSVKTYSGFTNFNLNDNTSIYTNLVNQENKWQFAEIGVVKILSEKLRNTEIDYLFGLAYVHSDINPSVVNFYLQIWVD